MELVKDVLFNVFIFIGMTTICLALIWYILVLLNHIFEFTKYIIMYLTYKRNIELYDLKNKVIVSKNGSVSYSCIDDWDEQIEILEKAIKTRKELKKLQEEYSK